MAGWRPAGSGGCPPGLWGGGLAGWRAAVRGLWVVDRRALPCHGPVAHVMGQGPCVVAVAPAASLGRSFRALSFEGYTGTCAMRYWQAGVRVTKLQKSEVCIHAIQYVPRIERHPSTSSGTRVFILSRVVSPRREPRVWEHASEQHATMHATLLPVCAAQHI